MLEAYSFGEIKIDGNTYTADVIVYPDHVTANWWRQEGHSLSLNDIQEILEYKPDTLVIGCGASGVMTVPLTIKATIEKTGIEVKIAKTGEAVKIFNQLQNAGGKVVAALHLTC